MLRYTFFFVLPLLAPGQRSNNGIKYYGTSNVRYQKSDPWLVSYLQKSQPNPVSTITAAAPTDDIQAVTKVPIDSYKSSRWHKTKPILITHENQTLQCHPFVYPNQDNNQPLANQPLICAMGPLQAGNSAHHSASRGHSQQKLESHSKANSQVRNSQSSLKINSLLQGMTSSLKPTSESKATFKTIISANRAQIDSKSNVKERVVETSQSSLNETSQILPQYNVSLATGIVSQVSPSSTHLFNISVSVPISIAMASENLNQSITNSNFSIKNQNSNYHLDNSEFTFVPQEIDKLKIASGSTSQLGYKTVTINQSDTSLVTSVESQNSLQEIDKLKTASGQTSKLGHETVIINKSGSSLLTSVESHDSPQMMSFHTIPALTASQVSDDAISMSNQKHLGSGLNITDHLSNNFQTSTNTSFQKSIVHTDFQFATGNISQQSTTTLNSQSSLAVPNESIISETLIHSVRHPDFDTDLVTKLNGLHNTQQSTETVSQGIDKASGQSSQLNREALTINESGSSSLISVESLDLSQIKIFPPIPTLIDSPVTNDAISMSNQEYLGSELNITNQLNSSLHTDFQFTTANITQQTKTSLNSQSSLAVPSISITSINHSVEHPTSYIELENKVNGLNKSPKPTETVSLPISFGIAGITYDASVGDSEHYLTEQVNGSFQSSLNTTASNPLSTNIQLFTGNMSQFSTVLKPNVAETSFPTRNIVSERLVENIGVTSHNANLETKLGYLANNVLPRKNNDLNILPKQTTQFNLESGSNGEILMQSTHDMESSNHSSSIILGSTQSTYSLKKNSVERHRSQSQTIHQSMSDDSSQPPVEINFSLQKITSPPTPKLHGSQATVNVTDIANNTQIDSKSQITEIVNSTFQLLNNTSAYNSLDHNLRLKSDNAEMNYISVPNVAMTAEGLLRTSKNPGSFNANLENVFNHKRRTKISATTKKSLITDFQHVAVNVSQDHHILKMSHGQIKTGHESVTREKTERQSTHAVKSSKQLHISNQASHSLKLNPVEQHESHTMIQSLTDVSSQSPTKSTYLLEEITSHQMPTQMGTQRQVDTDHHVTKQTNTTIKSSLGATSQSFLSYKKFHQATVNVTQLPVVPNSQVTQISKTELIPRESHAQKILFDKTSTDGQKLVFQTKIDSQSTQAAESLNQLLVSKQASRPLKLNPEEQYGLKSKTIVQSLTDVSSQPSIPTLQLPGLVESKILGTPTVQVDSEHCVTEHTNTNSKSSMNATSQDSVYFDLVTSVNVSQVAEAPISHLAHIKKPDLTSAISQSLENNHVLKPQIKTISEFSQEAVSSANQSTAIFAYNASKPLSYSLPPSLVGESTVRIQLQSDASPHSSTGFNYSFRETGSTIKPQINESQTTSNVMSTQQIDSQHRVTEQVNKTFQSLQSATSHDFQLPTVHVSQSHTPSEQVVLNHVQSSKGTLDQTATGQKSVSHGEIERQSIQAMESSNQLHISKLATTEQVDETLHSLLSATSNLQLAIVNATQSHEAPKLEILDQLPKTVLTFVHQENHLPKISGHKSVSQGEIERQSTQAMKSLNQSNSILFTSKQASHSLKQNPKDQYGLTTQKIVQSLTDVSSQLQEIASYPMPLIESDISSDSRAMATQGQVDSERHIAKQTSKDFQSFLNTSSQKLYPSFQYATGNVSKLYIALQPQISLSNQGSATFEKHVKPIKHSTSNGLALETKSDLSVQREPIVTPVGKNTHKFVAGLSSTPSDESELRQHTIQSTLSLHTSTQLSSARLNSTREHDSRPQTTLYPLPDVSSHSTVGSASLLTTITSSSIPAVVEIQTTADGEATEKQSDREHHSSEKISKTLLSLQNSNSEYNNLQLDSGNLAVFTKTQDSQVSHDLTYSHPTVMEFKTKLDHTADTDAIGVSPGKKDLESVKVQISQYDQEQANGKISGQVKSSNQDTSFVLNSSQFSHSRPLEPVQLNGFMPQTNFSTHYNVSALSSIKSNQSLQDSVFSTKSKIIGSETVSDVSVTGSQLEHYFTEQVNKTFQSSLNMTSQNSAYSKFQLVSGNISALNPHSLSVPATEVAITSERLVSKYPAVKNLILEEKFDESTLSELARKPQQNVKHSVLTTSLADQGDIVMQSKQETETSSQSHSVLLASKLNSMDDYNSKSRTTLQRLVDTSNQSSKSQATVKAAGITNQGQIDSESIITGQVVKSLQSSLNATSQKSLNINLQQSKRKVSKTNIIRKGQSDVKKIHVAQSQKLRSQPTLPAKKPSLIQQKTVTNSQHVTITQSSVISDSARQENDSTVMKSSVIGSRESADGTYMRSSVQIDTTSQISAHKDNKIQPSLNVYSNNSLGTGVQTATNDTTMLSQTTQDNSQSLTRNLQASKLLLSVPDVAITLEKNTHSEMGSIPHYPTNIALKPDSHILSNYTSTAFVPNLEAASHNDSSVKLLSDKPASSVRISPDRKINSQAASQIRSVSSYSESSVATTDSLATENKNTLSAIKLSQNFQPPLNSKIFLEPAEHLIVSSQTIRTNGSQLFVAPNPHVSQIAIPAPNLLLTSNKLGQRKSNDTTANSIQSHKSSTSIQTITNSQSSMNTTFQTSVSSSLETAVNASTILSSVHVNGTQQTISINLKDSHASVSVPDASIIFHTQEIENSALNRTQFEPIPKPQLIYPLKTEKDVSKSQTNLLSHVSVSEVDFVSKNATIPVNTYQSSVKNAYQKSLFPQPSTNNESIAVAPQFSQHTQSAENIATTSTRDFSSYVLKSNAVPQPQAIHQTEKQLPSQPIVDKTITSSSKSTSSLDYESAIAHQSKLKEKSVSISKISSSHLSPIPPLPTKHTASPSSSLVDSHVVSTTTGAQSQINSSFYLNTEGTSKTQSTQNIDTHASLNTTVNSVGSIFLTSTANTTKLAVNRQIPQVIDPIAKSMKNLTSFKATSETTLKPTLTHAIVTEKTSQPQLFSVESGQKANYVHEHKSNMSPSTLLHTTLESSLQSTSASSTYNNSSYEMLSNVKTDTNAVADNNIHSIEILSPYQPNLIEKIVFQVPVNVNALKPDVSKPQPPLFATSQRPLLATPQAPDNFHPQFVIDNTSKIQAINRSRESFTKSQEPQHESVDNLVPVQKPAADTVTVSFSSSQLVTDKNNIEPVNVIYLTSKHENLRKSGSTFQTGSTTESYTGKKISLKSNATKSEHSFKGKSRPSVVDVSEYPSKHANLKKPLVNSSSLEQKSNHNLKLEYERTENSTTKYSIDGSRQRVTLTSSGNVSTISPSRLISQQLDFICMVRNGYYAVDNECHTYIQCKEYKATKYACSNGLYFNPAAKDSEYPCANPSTVKCVERFKKHKSSLIGLCTRQYGLFSMHDGDCSKYIMCNAGVATIMNCPVGLVFNPLTESCDWLANVPQCNPHVFNDYVCPESKSDDVSLEPDMIFKYKYKQHCKLYIACQRGFPRLLSCEKGLAFDEDSQSCVKSKFVKNCTIP